MLKLFLAYEKKKKRSCTVIVWHALLYCIDLVIPAV